MIEARRNGENCLAHRSGKKTPMGGYLNNLSKDLKISQDFKCFVGSNLILKYHQDIFPDILVVSGSLNWFVKPWSVGKDHHSELQPSGCFLRQCHHFT